MRENFFIQKEMKKLRRIAGGDTYTIIYLKMQLLSLKNKGVVVFENIGEDIADELALELDESVENVQMTIAFLQQHGLIERISSDEYVMSEAVRSIGSENASAERMRKLRERNNQEQKLLPSQCDTDVTLELDTDIDKELYPPISPHGEAADLQESFKLFWNAYPKKKSVGIAEKAWRKLQPTAELVQQILSAIAQQKLSSQWRKENGRYIPAPKNWLEGRCWEDERRIETNASYDIAEIEQFLNQQIGGF